MKLEDNCFLILKNNKDKVAFFTHPALNGKINLFLKYLEKWKNRNQWFRKKLVKKSLLL